MRVSPQCVLCVADANIYRHPAAYGYPEVPTGSVADPKFGGPSRGKLRPSRGSLFGLTPTRPRAWPRGRVYLRRDARSQRTPPQTPGERFSRAISSGSRPPAREPTAHPSAGAIPAQDGLDWIPSSATNAQHKLLRDGKTELIRHYCSCARHEPARARPLAARPPPSPPAPARAWCVGVVC